MQSLLVLVGFFVVSNITVVFLIAQAQKDKLILTGYIPYFIFSRVEISKKGEAYKMIIKNLAETDAGEYMCKVGDRPTKCQVTVEECK